MVNPQNVLQFEFFHVGGPEINTVEEVFTQCAERTADSLEMVLSGHETRTGITTVIRIYDTEGKVTIWAKKIEELKNRNEYLYELCETP